MYLFYVIAYVIAAQLSYGSAQRNNAILFIIDDLRPEIGRYLGTDNSLYPGIQTPNLDAFADTAVTFTEAHTQVSSRSS